MAENAAAAVSLPPVRLDPTQGSSPALNTQDPWAAFPAAPPPASLATPISLDEIRAGQVAPSAPAPAPTPAPAGNDPWAAFPKAETTADSWEAFPKAGELKGYDLTKLKKTSVADLVKDKAEFNPVDFYARNTEALLADPAALDLVEKAYEQREHEKMSAKEFFLKANPIYAILHPVQAAKTAEKIITGGAKFVGELGKGVGQVFATGGQIAGNLSTGDLKGASKGISEAADAFDSAQQHWVTTITSKLLPRPDNVRERLAYDADFKRREIAAAAGNGELARALGTDQEGLKASGVTLDTDAIQKLSVIEDPMFLVPVGGAIGVVGRGGKFLLGRAASPAVAEAFAKTINGAMDVAVGGAVTGTGNVAGKALERVGAAVENSPALLGRVGGQVRTGGIVHAFATGDPSFLISTIAAPIALKYTGKALGATGRGVQALAPVAGRLAVEGTKGAAEGAALSVPLFIGSTPEERDALLGMVGGAGLLRAGATGVGLAGDVAARAAQEKLASKIYEPVSRGPVVDSAHYGTDPKLDLANTEQTAKLPAGEQSVLNWAREFFRNSGVEIYALDTPTFRNHVPDVAGAEAAEGFFIKRGERIGPDGTRQPVVQVLLNRETNGLGHELYHAFKSLDPRSAQVLEAQISKTWTPEEQAWLSDTYNAALNGGKPKSQWAVRYDEKQILEEAAAEVFGRVLNATDLSGVRPSVVKRASEFASRALEKMGYPLGAKALPSGPGVSALGVRPGTGELKVARDFLTDITKRVQNGTLSPPKAGGPLTAGPQVAISRRPKAPAPPTPSEAPAASAAPQPATPPPLPITPPESAVAPAVSEPLRPAEPTAPNIRVTPAEQADFAAARSAVTNADQALNAASPEQAPKVQAINDAMAAGHAVEIVHKGVIREGGPTPEAPVARGTRRAEQEAAYVAEALGAVPESVREPHQKVFFGTRWIKGGKQLTARSLDKALANVKNAADMAAQTKTTLPYEVEPTTGKLSEAGWSEVVQDLKDYWTNQDRGFRGDGLPLSAETRTRDIGQSIPPQDPAGPAALISPERTDFLNLVQGLNIPRAVTRQTKGVIPGNVKGQLLAEAQGRKPAAPSRIAPEDVQRQTYKPIEGVGGVRSIAEVNPLRNELRAQGAPVENLIEVTENIKADNIESVTPRPDIAGRGGSTDITRAGFSVSDVKSEVARRLEEKRKAGIPITEAVRRKTQQEVEFDQRNPRRVRPQETGVFSVTPNKEVRDVAEKGEPGFVPATERPFGEQKNIVIPDELIKEAKGVEADTRPIAERGAEYLKQTPAEWAETIKGFDGGVTKEAFKVGLGLKDKADVQVLKELGAKASDEFNALMTEVKNGNFDKMDDMGPVAMKKQFFQEAYEAATGTGGKALRERVFPGQKPPFETTMESFSPARNFADDVDPIERAAIRTTGGHVVTGSWHGEALDNLAQQVGRGEVMEKIPPGVKEIYDLYDVGFLTDGFVTRSGKFLNREEAAAHAKEIGQLKESRMGEHARGGSLESDEFRGTRSFSVKRKGKARETEKEALKRKEATDYSKYNVPEEAKEVKTSGTGWFFPDKEFVPLDQAYHEQFLAENAGQLNERFGTNFKPESDVEQRLDALDKGFIRSRYQPANGRWHIEANANHWDVGARRAVFDLLEKHQNSLDSLNVSLLDNKGNVVDRISEKLYDLEGPEKLDIVKTTLEEMKTSAEVSTKGPSNITRIRSLPGEFSVKSKVPEEATPATGEHVTQKKAAGTPEFNAYAQNKIEKSKEFPEAFPLEFRQDKNGNYRAQWDGEPLPKAKEYNLLKSDLAQKSGSQEKFAEALSEKLQREYNKAKKNPEVAEGEHWYSTFRDKVGRVLGEDTKLFAELLGATSPQQAVGPNFKDALGAYNQFKSGAYDAMLEKYREGKKKFADGDLTEFTAETGKTGKKATYEAFMNWWQLKHDLIPKKATGKKFGMNSKSVLKVLDRSWLQGVQGPKTPNFTGNLSGTTFKATIDVWAMRLLSRLAGEDGKGPWRIQPANESGVKDKEFFFGQDAFQRAADKLGIKADALQAILWFAEKDLWEKNGWTGAAGKAKSDYNTLLDRTTRTPEGKLHFAEAEVKPRSKKKPTQLELTDINAKKD